MSRQLGQTEVKRLNRSWRRVTQARLCLLLESVSQPFNVGSVVRTAAALGVERIWLCGDTADPDHASARKTALGTGRFLTFERAPSLPAAVAEIAGAGLRLVAVELAEGAIPLHRAAVGGDVCLALGNEDRGCSAALLAAAAQIAYVPQLGRVGSLNVAAAAAIAMAEARRREWAGQDGAPADDGEAGHETMADDQAPAERAGSDNGRPDDRGARR